MKVKILKAVTINGKLHSRGKEYDINAELAKKYVAAGYAVAASADPKGK